MPGATPRPVAAAAPAPAPPAAETPPIAVVETGTPGVDAALARLGAVGELPGEARAGVYGEVHDLLRDTLAGLEERPGGVPTPLNANR